MTNQFDFEFELLKKDSEKYAEYLKQKENYEKEKLKVKLNLLKFKGL